MSSSLNLLKILADGRFHSGEDLGRELGVSRTAVWKQIKGLEALGLDCYSVPGKGYRLAAPVELLCPTQIRSAMAQQGSRQPAELEIHPDISSTNRYLMERVGGGLSSGHACLAERQSAGRGRRGREWVSPFGRNIYLSLYWRFPLSPSALSGLALAIGVAIVRALEVLGIEGAGLKWPNDVLWRGRKLAGILLEMSGEASGPYHVVAGIGLNVDMGNVDAGIGQPWVDLVTAAGGHISRNQVAGLLLHHLLETMERYQHEGFAPFVDGWHQRDLYHGEQVRLTTPVQTIEGLARGVDADGALKLETASGLQCFHSGEVSLRAVTP